MFDGVESVPNEWELIFMVILLKQSEFIQMIHLLQPDGSSCSNRWFNFSSQLIPFLPTSLWNLNHFCEVCTNMLTYRHTLFWPCANIGPTLRSVSDLEPSKQHKISNNWQTALIAEPFHFYRELLYAEIHYRAFGHQWGVSKALQVCQPAILVRSLWGDHRPPGRKAFGFTSAPVLQSLSNPPTKKCGNPWRPKSFTRGFGAN